MAPWKPVISRASTRLTARCCGVGSTSPSHPPRDSHHLTQPSRLPACLPVLLQGGEGQEGDVFVAAVEDPLPMGDKAAKCDRWVNQAMEEMGGINICEFGEWTYEVGELGQGRAARSGTGCSPAWPSPPPACRRHLCRCVPSGPSQGGTPAGADATQPPGWPQHAPPHSRCLHVLGHGKIVFDHEQMLSRIQVSNPLNSCAGKYDPCIDSETEAYLNRRDVQLALHANISGQLPGPWTDCTQRIEYSRCARGSLGRARGQAWGQAWGQHAWTQVYSCALLRQARLVGVP